MTKNAASPMVKRLENFKLRELNDITIKNSLKDSVEEFISDIGYGWNRQRISNLESIELFKSLFQRISEEKVMIPPVLLSCWLDLIAMQTKPDVNQVKSIKLFQAPPKNHRENLIAFVPLLLDHLQSSFKTPAREFTLDQIAEFLVGLPKNCQDTQYLLQEYSKLPAQFTTARGWSMLLAKYCSQSECNLEYLFDMIQIMILRDKIFPVTAIAPILRQVFLKARPDKLNFTNFSDDTMLMDIIIRI